jgi:hypothetical protein
MAQDIGRAELFGEQQKLGDRARVRDRDEILGEQMRCSVFPDVTSVAMNLHQKLKRTL